MQVPVVAELYRNLFELVCNTITELDFNGLGWSAREALLLAKSIPEMGSLTSLDLRHNNLGPEGGKALAPAIAGSGSLTELQLGSNNLKDEGVMSICNAVKENKEMKLATLSFYNNGVGPAGAQSVAAMLAGTGSLTKVRALCLSLPSVLLNPLCVCFSSISSTTVSMQKQQKHSRRR